MDPYLEAHWRDVHASLVIYIRDALQDHLPPELRARVEERVVLERPEGIGNGLYPDVRVVEYRRPPGERPPPEAGGGDRHGRADPRRGGARTPHGRLHRDH